MYHVAHFLRASSYPWHENSISPSLNPANFAERFADSTTSFLMSLEYILYSQSNCIDSALFFSSSNNHLGIQFQLSGNAKRLLSHGAIFFAIIRASIAIVPDPQNRS